MVQRSMCFYKCGINNLPQLVREEALLDITQEGFTVVFSYSSVSGHGYTQERYCYPWDSATWRLFPGEVLMLSGQPEIRLNNVPIVFAQESRRCTLLSSNNYTIMLQLTAESSCFVREHIDRFVEGKKC